MVTNLATLDYIQYYRSLRKECYNDFVCVGVLGLGDSSKILNKHKWTKESDKEIKLLIVLVVNLIPKGD